MTRRRGRHRRQIRIQPTSRRLTQLQSAQITTHRRHQQPIVPDRILRQGTIQPREPTLRSLTNRHARVHRLTSRRQTRQLQLQLRLSRRTSRRLRRHITTHTTLITKIRPRPPRLRPQTPHSNHTMRPNRQRVSHHRSSPFFPSSHAERILGVTSKSAAAAANESGDTANAVRTAVGSRSQPAAVRSALRSRLRAATSSMGA